MIAKFVFYFGHLFTRPKVLFYYAKFLRNEKKSYETLQRKQMSEIVSYVKFCQKNINFYKGGLNVSVEADDFVESYNKVALLDKNNIKGYEGDFCDPTLTSYKRGQTGGSTGDPLKYRISNECSDYALAMLYRGLSRGGYSLGDKLAVMAGGSLIGKDKNFKTKALSYLMNVRKYSSYGVSDELFESYYRDIKAWAPHYIRGYATSLYEFAKFVRDNDYELSFRSVFTTAEVLLPHQRELIESVFDTHVYDGYGLNDGGITAFECKEKAGFHIDLERAYLEVVDENGFAVFDQLGRIVATSYRNKATAFIRYLTGDLGVVSKTSCRCGSPYPLLTNLAGRTTDVLRVNKRMIGGPVLTVLMANVNAARYQFIKIAPKRILLVIDPAEGYGEKDESFIRASLFSNLGEFDLEFSYKKESFELADGGKHKFVIDRSL